MLPVAVQVAACASTYTTVCVALGLSKAEKDEMMRIAFPEEEVWDEILEKRMNIIDANIYLKERNLHELGSADPKQDRHIPL